MFPYLTRSGPGKYLFVYKCYDDDDDDSVGDDKMMMVMIKCLINLNPIPGIHQGKL